MALTSGTPVAGPRYPTSLSNAGRWRCSGPGLLQGVAHPCRTYRRRDTESSVHHAVIREHLELCLREVSVRGDGRGLPRFVEQEFRGVLT